MEKSPTLRTIETRSRVPLGLIVAWAAIWTLPHLSRNAVSWRFFDLAGRALWSGARDGGLHVYAAHPALQFGPVAMLAASAVRLAGADARLVAIGTLALLGYVLLRVIERLEVDGAPRLTRGRMVAATLVFVPVWMELAVHYAHIDDALALVFVVLAVREAGKGRAMTTAILLALAADSKPWAIAFVPLLLLVPRASRIRAVIVWAGVLVAAWLPFVLGDPRTLGVTGFAIPNTATSALRALGVATQFTPAWDRPLQIAFGCLLAGAAVKSHRWPAALFIAIAVRLLIDPGTYSYYTSGLVLGALLVDLYLTKRRIPIFALGAFVLVYAVRALPVAPSLLGELRAGYCIAAIAAVFFLAPLPRRSSLHAIEGGRFAVGCSQLERKAS